MNKETKSAIERWVNGAGPDTPHQYDIERFYNIIFQCLVYEDRLNSEELANIIRENLSWEKESIEEFAEKKSILADYIIGFIEYLETEMKISIFEKL